MVSRYVVDGIALTGIVLGMVTAVLATYRKAGGVVLSAVSVTAMFSLLGALTPIRLWPILQWPNPGTPLISGVTIHWLNGLALGVFGGVLLLQLFALDALRDSVKAIEKETEEHQLKLREAIKELEHSLSEAFKELEHSLSEDSPPKHNDPVIQPAVPDEPQEDPVAFGSRMLLALARRVIALIGLIMFRFGVWLVMLLVAHSIAQTVLSAPFMGFREAVLQWVLAVPLSILLVVVAYGLSALGQRINMVAQRRARLIGLLLGLVSIASQVVGPLLDLLGIKIV